MRLHIVSSENVLFACTQVLLDFDCFSAVTHALYNVYFLTSQNIETGFGKIRNNLW